MDYGKFNTSPFSLREAGNKNVIDTNVFMAFYKGLEIKDFALPIIFKGSQPESYQVNNFPAHAVGHCSKPYPEFLNVRLLNRPKVKDIG